MKATKKDGEITIRLEKKLDATNAESTRDFIMQTIESSPGCKIVLDAADLEYVSSMGLRIFLVIRKKTDRTLLLKNVAPAVYDILDMTQMCRAIDIEAPDGTLVTVADTK